MPVFIYGGVGVGGADAQCFLVAAHLGHPPTKNHPVISPGELLFSSFYHRAAQIMGVFLIPGRFIRGAIIACKHL